MDIHTTTINGQTIDIMYEWKGNSIDLYPNVELSNKEVDRIKREIKEGELVNEY